MYHDAMSKTLVCLSLVALVLGACQCLPASAREKEPVQTAGKESQAERRVYVMTIKFMPKGSVVKGDSVAERPMGDDRRQPAFAHGADDVVGRVCRRDFLPWEDVLPGSIVTGPNSTGEHFAGNRYVILSKSVTAGTLLSPSNLEERPAGLNVPPGSIPCMDKVNGLVLKSDQKKGIVLKAEMVDITPELLKDARRMQALFGHLWAGDPRVTGVDR